MNEKVQVYGLARGSNKFHPASIRPRRIADSGSPIETAFGERVIIIGPDISSNLYRGEYAQIVKGDAPEGYADVILTDGAPLRFHRTSLCLARNREIYGEGEHLFPATVFPATSSGPVQYM